MRYTSVLAPEAAEEKPAVGTKFALNYTVAGEPLRGAAPDHPLFRGIRTSMCSILLSREVHGFRRSPSSLAVAVQ